MKKLLLLSFVFVAFLPQSVFSQKKESSGGDFIKRIEFNYSHSYILMGSSEIKGTYNVDSKTELEKRFFGDFNAEVEYFLFPPFDGAYGFRIVTSSKKDSSYLEVKYISNFKEVEAKMAEKYPAKGLTTEDMRTKSAEEREQILKNYHEMLTKRRQEGPTLYNIDTKRTPISNLFARKMHEKISTSINNFKGTIYREEGREQVVLDGEIMTFRCVVEDEVWTLRIHVPEGDIKKLSKFCEQIFSDAKADKFDESKYLGLLEN